MACDTSQAFMSYDSSLKDCVCDEPRYVMEVDDGTNTGTLFKQCSDPCDQSAWPGPEGTTINACQPCPHEGQSYDYLQTIPVCVCDEASGWVTAADGCLLQSITTRFTDANSEYAESRANQISYSSIETRTGPGTDWAISAITHNSGTIQYYFLDAAVGCTQLKDVQKCQLLANLCVLMLYNPNSEVCALYKDTVAELPDLAYPDFYSDDGFKMDQD